MHGVVPPSFSASPLGWGDVADDRLPTLGDVDMLNRHLLLAAPFGIA